MVKKVILSVIAVVLVLVALGGVKALQIGNLIAFGKSFSPPPETVSTATAKEEKWQETIPAIASISAVQGVKVTAEVAGTVAEIKFESGAVVAKGDLLVHLDTATEEAQLRALEAQVELSELNFKRMENLRRENTVSQAELDQAASDLKQKRATADATRATIEKKIIRAPFAGKLGIRQVNLGQYLDAGHIVVSLQSLKPVYADFSLPQQDLARLKPGLPVRVTTDTYTNEIFSGTITALNPDLDSATRSVRLQATLSNDRELLRPGMFARVEVLLPDEHPVLAIPATSVLSAPYSDSVYVVEPSTNGAGGLIVRQQLIRTGRAKGDFVSVTVGLKPGERVVTSGIFKLRNLMPVVENNEIAPSSEKKPNPSDS